MHHRSEVREFLTSRRAKVTPVRAGLLACSGNRCVTASNPARRHDADNKHRAQRKP
ncbi:hypothetical protein AB0D59_24190 [Streptomyces sp. NPDC048417]|uniref:hypothetical protein n=1 Tax=Streptomyces sp. NPDC048417 TaxID=3155387 RepID=UPI003440F1C5